LVLDLDSSGSEHAGNLRKLIPTRWRYRLFNIVWKLMPVEVALWIFVIHPLDDDGMSYPSAR
jgi:hypothetical protein